jgi:thiol-disulfide isomerase/thioredoxin
MKREAFASALAGGALLNGIPGNGLLAQMIDISATPSPIPEVTWHPVEPPKPPPSEGCVNPGKVPLDRPLGLKLRVLDGPDLHLESLHGNAVWLNFFATWCGPCHREMPDIVALANRRYDEGLRVVGIDVGEDDDRVRAFRKKYGIKFPIAMDNNSGVFTALKLFYYPTSMFLKPSGRLACIRRGSLSASEMSSELMKVGLAPPLPAVPTPSSLSS